MENLNNSIVEGKNENVIAPNVKKEKKAKKSSAKEDVQTNVNTSILDKINALNISEKITEKGGKRSIFKKEFNNKSDRTKCRDKFINYVSLYLLQLKHNKKEDAEKYLNLAKEISNKYYIAESNFQNANDYCTENMQEDKKGIIKLFIEIQKELNPTK